MAGNLLGNPHLIQAAEELTQAGMPFALATVVYRKAPVSAHIGDKAIITAEGRLIGWIGGSCSQGVVRREGQAAIASGRPRLLRLTPEPDGEPAADGLSTVPMTCPSGGEMEIYIEPQVLAPQVVAVGGTPLVRALGQLAPVLGFDVTLVGERGEHDGAEGVQVLTLPELQHQSLGANAFVVVASAGHYDEEALLAALQTSVPYIALVASRRRAEAVLEVLAGSGCSSEQLQRVRAPAGLALGAVTQEEIALSVLAEIVQEYRQRQQQQVAAASAAGPLELPLVAPALAKDPVCGMDVEIEGARHKAEYNGATYYFCCPHCRQHFLKAPEQYLESRT